VLLGKTATVLSRQPSRPRRLLRPGLVTSGDFNGDGRLDLSVGQPSSNNGTSCWGNGDGTFLPAVNYSVGDTPSSVTSGPSRRREAGSGRGQFYSHTVSVLLGIGDGSSSQLSHGVRSQPELGAKRGPQRRWKLDLARSMQTTIASACFWVRRRQTFKTAVTTSRVPALHPGGPECGDERGTSTATGRWTWLRPIHAAKTSASCSTPDACPDARGRGHNPKQRSR